MAQLVHALPHACKRCAHASIRTVEATKLQCDLWGFHFATSAPPAYSRSLAGWMGAGDTNNTKEAGANNQSDDAHKAPHNSAPPKAPHKAPHKAPPTTWHLHQRQTTKHIHIHTDTHTRCSTHLVWNFQVHDAQPLVASLTRTQHSKVACPTGHTCRRSGAARTTEHVQHPHATQLHAPP